VLAAPAVALLAAACGSTSHDLSTQTVCTHLKQQLAGAVMPQNEDIYGFVSNTKDVAQSIQEQTSQASDSRLRAAGDKVDAQLEQVIKSVQGDAHTNAPTVSASVPRLVAQLDSYCPGLSSTVANAAT
jgi:hypothetical protein